MISCDRSWLLRVLGLLILGLGFVTSSNSISFGQSSQNAAVPDRGVRANGSYSVSDIERISLTNGNVGLSIPLAELPPIAGGRLSFGIRAVYNSKLWDAKRDEVKTDAIPASTYVKDVPQLGDGGGWRIGGAYSIDFKDSRFDFGRQDPSPDDPEYDLLTQNQWVKVILTDPDGATHELRPADYTPYQGIREFLWGFYRQTPDSVGGTMRYYSLDGSYVWARMFSISSPISWEVYLRDGTTIV